MRLLFCRSERAVGEGFFTVDLARSIQFARESPYGHASDPLTEFHGCPETLERQFNVPFGVRTINRSLADFGKT
jgi:hypothetical protein